MHSRKIKNSGYLQCKIFVSCVKYCNTIISHYYYSFVVCLFFVLQFILRYLKKIYNAIKTMDIWWPINWLHANIGQKSSQPPDWATQWFGTYMKLKSYTGAVVISLHCKHNMFTYISVSHKHTAKHCIISQFHTNIKAPY